MQNKARTRKKRVYGPITLDEIVASCVKTDAGCLEWQYGKTRQGYGLIRRDKRQMLVSRVIMYLLFNYDPCSRSLFVLHHCDNPPCINPEHLFLGTIKDNANDRIAKYGFYHA